MNTTSPEAQAAVEAPSRHRGRFGAGVLAGLLIAVSFVAYFATSATKTSDQLNLDAWSANYESWTIATTGKPWIHVESIPSFVDNPIASQWVMDPAPNGHQVIGRFPGVIAVGIPAYWLLHPHSMTTMPGALTASLLTAVALGLFFLGLQQLMPRRRALLCAVVLGFTTPAWSVSANGVWPHTVTFFGICGMTWAASTRRWWLVGLFGGITLWGRIHGALVVAVLGLVVGWRRKAWSITAKIAAVSLTFLGLMSVWTHWMYGTWSPMGSYAVDSFEQNARTQWFNPVNQLGFWVSPDRGILIWTPVVLLLLPALFRSWRALPDWTQALVAGGLVYVVVQGVFNTFPGGDLFYGYRYGIETMTCLAPALALSLPQMGRVARQLMGPVLGIQAFAIGIGAITNRLMLSKKEVWKENAFEMAVWHAGVFGLIAVLLAAGLGWLLARVWVDLERHVAAAA